MYKAIYIIDTYFGGIYTILTAIVYRRIIIYIVNLWHFKILHDEYKLFSKRGPKKKDLGGFLQTLALLNFSPYHTAFSLLAGACGTNEYFQLFSYFLIIFQHLGEFLHEILSLTRIWQISLNSIKFNYNFRNFSK